MKTKILIIATAVILALTGGTTWAVPYFLNVIETTELGEPTVTTDLPQTTITLGKEAAKIVQVTSPGYWPIGTFARILEEPDSTVVSDFAVLIIKNQTSAPVQTFTLFFFSDGADNFATELAKLPDSTPRLKETGGLQVLATIQATNPSDPGLVVSVQSDVESPAVAEPTTMLLLGSGLLGLAGLRRMYKVR